jgi:uncharacterized coiled-coil protein SlyX
MNASWKLHMTQAILCLILLASSACSLITVERIADQQPSGTAAFEPDAMTVSLQTRLADQDQTIREMSTQIAVLSTQASALSTQVSYLATRGPAQLTENQTPSPGGIIGSVLIEDGRCCVGATVGEQIEIQVRFTAVGLEAPVLLMRTSSGGYSGAEDALEAAPWEPFLERKSFTYRVPINWTGFYVQVQFQDALGNISAIYSDDISVEGMPASTPSQGE